MNKPTLLDPLPVAPETYAISAYYPIPGLGILPMSAFVILGKHPIVIDAGPCPLSEQFMARLESILDPRDLQFLWLTHTDADHVGAVEHLLAAAPHARVVTTFLGAAKMGLRRPIPEDRLHLLNPGDRLDLEDRELVALRPPTYDAPRKPSPLLKRGHEHFSRPTPSAPRWRSRSFQPLKFQRRDCERASSPGPASTLPGSRMWIKGDSQMCSTRFLA
jgi:hypothetical protein